LNFLNILYILSADKRKGGIAVAIGDNIKRLRKSFGMTQMQLADKLGVSNKTVSSWEAGEGAKVPRMDVIEKMSALFGITKAAIIDGEQSSVGFLPTGSFFPIQIAGAVRAGYGGVAFEEYGDTEVADVKNPEDYVYFRVTGDSMAPAINDGDLALVRKQQDVDSGQIAVVVVNGEEGTIKRVVKGSGSIALQPFNHAYETRVFTGPDANEVRIAGLVVETKRKWA
jgi:repressor LexA